MPRFLVRTTHKGKTATFLADAASPDAASEQYLLQGHQVLQVQPEGSDPLPPPRDPHQSRLLTNPVETIAKGIIVGWIFSILITIVVLALLRATGLIALVG